jgi:hypothetical protein
MGVMEQDPRDIGYIALYCCIKWHCEISSEAALRIAQGQSQAKRGNKLTPEILAEITRITNSPNFHNIHSVVKHFRINKYEIYKALSGDKNAGEEALVMIKTDGMFEKVNSVAIQEKVRQIKALKGKMEVCKAIECDRCIHNNDYNESSTICEYTMDHEIDTENALKIFDLLEKISARQMQDICNTTIESLSGAVKTKTYRIDKKAIEAIEKFIKEHKKEKTQDVVSLALLEYVERHK